MGNAKDIILRPISSTEANALVRRVHYSGKVVNNSQFHIGVFYHGKLEGAMQFGPSLDKRKMLGLVEGTGWNEFIELNRMAFSDALPRNSESRAIGIAFRILKKHAPHIKWAVSFADAAQCGDGTIYRASGFVLTAIKENNSLWAMPDGGAANCCTTVTKGSHIIADIALRRGFTPQGGMNLTASGGGGSNMRAYVAAGYKPIPGFQLRYIYFLDPTARQRLTVPILPFSDIEKRGAGMYKGKSRAASIDSDAPGFQPEEGGADPTAALQLTD